MPVKECGLALLSPCGPSLFLGVEFALDAFFQLTRPDGGPFDGGTEDPNPAPSSRTSPTSLADTDGQHRRRPMADFLESHRRARAALFVDVVRSQTARRRARGKQEVPCRIKAERTGHSLGWYVPSRRQMPSLGIDSEGSDTAAVSRAVAEIEEPPGGRQVDLRAGGALTVTGGQSRGRLHGREGAVRAVKPLSSRSLRRTVEAAPDRPQPALLLPLTGDKRNQPQGPVLHVTFKGTESESMARSQDSCAPG